MISIDVANYWKDSKCFVSDILICFSLLLRTPCLVKTVYTQTYKNDSQKVKHKQIAIYYENQTAVPESRFSNLTLSGLGIIDKCVPVDVPSHFWQNN